ncbi:MAG: biotin--[acetyl-CoA-carboxylase] ligase [Planctomycetaceae bacterium]|jgi:BirA family biotin operon repressor/biotin-[acetyl-CoA-carboxylase] ligase|nr:biotin--[acetyl-CoA-carboxylase] ligase [Planctomycetaceae bacterium]
MRDSGLEDIELCELLPVRVYEYHELISSTSDRVREIFSSCSSARSVDCGGIFPCLVVAGKQAAGRGRGNKKWWSAKGCLMMSFGLELDAEYFPIRREVLPEFSPIVGNIVSDVLTKYILPSDVIEVHHPNDVCVNRKKIAGILIESPKPNFVIIGIGININNSAKDVPNDFDREITTVFDLTGNKTDLRKILSEFVKAFFETIHRNRYER